MQGAVGEAGKSMPEYAAVGRIPGTMQQIAGYDTSPLFHQPSRVGSFISPTDNAPSFPERGESAIAVRPVPPYLDLSGFRFASPSRPRKFWFMNLLLNLFSARE